MKKKKKKEMLPWIFPQTILELVWLLWTICLRQSIFQNHLPSPPLRVLKKKKKKKEKKEKIAIMRMRIVMTIRPMCFGLKLLKKRAC